MTLPPLKEELARKRRIKRAATLRPVADAALTAAIERLDQRQRALVTLVNTSTGFDAAEMLYDGLHPNDGGEQHLAKLVAPALRSAVAAAAPECGA